MGAQTVGHCLAKIWFFEIFNTDLATMEPAEAPLSVWMRMAAGLKLTPEQVSRGAGGGWAREGL